MFDAPPSLSPRQIWLGLLARASRERLLQLLDSAPKLPGFERLREPECGMAMIRGRMGGNGAPFNLGEMTITRCSIRDEAGRVGHGYAAGHDLEQVELVARLDAVLQDEALFGAYDQAVLQPLAQAQAARRLETEARAKATEVKFFTLATMRS